MDDFVMDETDFEELMKHIIDECYEGTIEEVEQYPHRFFINGDDFPEFFDELNNDQKIYGPFILKGLLTVNKNTILNQTRNRDERNRVTKAILDIKDFYIGKFHGIKRSFRQNEQPRIKEFIENWEYTWRDESFEIAELYFALKRAYLSRNSNDNDKEQYAREAIQPILTLAHSLHEEKMRRLRNRIQQQAFRGRAATATVGRRSTPIQIFFSNGPKQALWSRDVTSFSKGKRRTRRHKKMLGTGKRALPNELQGL